MNGFSYLISMLFIFGALIYCRDLLLKYSPKLRKYSQRRQYLIILVLFLAASRTFINFIGVTYGK